jgi:hypothetical protein
MIIKCSWGNTMKFRYHLLATALFIVALGLSSVANAALIDRGGGLIYDTDLDITWLADANITGMTSLGDQMTWDEARTWAANLSYYDSVRNVTYTDWRLPTTVQPDPGCSGQSNAGSFGLQGFGYNCTGSEMGHLFYIELGGVAVQSIATTHNANYNMFQNIQLNGYYWSDTEYAPNTGLAWIFGFNYGDQGTGTKDFPNYVWAVRSGDVAAVPLPATAWLFASGLIGLLGLSRKRRH